MQGQILQLAFSPAISQEQKDRIQQLVMQLELVNIQWELYDEQLEDSVQVLKHAKIVRAQSIIMSLQRPFQVLKPYIFFEKLHYLELQSCKIVDIQFLIKLDAPQLQCLILRDNQITGCKALRKCNFPNIQQIQLQLNPLLECDSLFELFGRTQCLIIQLQYYMFKLKFSGQNADENLSNMQEYKYLYCQSEQRILNNGFWNMIKEMKRKEQAQIKVFKYKNYSQM